ncbi:MAG TPA: hypothetical protein VFW04_10725 [Gemmatimonadaceae bacterium]|nr:hypothetical protein [Gemmatimonadaceae bacterium]
MLFRESGGLIAIPLIVGLLVLGEIRRCKAQAAVWPHLLAVALLVPPVLLCLLGEAWAGAGSFGWRPRVLLGLGVTELLLSVICVRAGRASDVMPYVVSVALVWSVMSWTYAALAVAGDSL